MRQYGLRNQNDNRSVHRLGKGDNNAMSTIRFEATPQKIGDWIILRLPASASTLLPSRGLAVVEGTINGFQTKIVLEPDGEGSHWFKLDPSLQRAAGINLGEQVALVVEPSKDLPEPEIPPDMAEALVSAPHAHALWAEITPMARWDWLRWIRATNNPETRRQRIEVALSKLNAGDRRPCCFNRNQCTEPAVSKKGVLIAPVLTSE